MKQDVRKVVVPLTTIAVISAFPAIAMFCQNADEAGFSEIVPVLLVYVAVGIVLFILFGLLTRSPEKAMITAALMVLLITNFLTAEKVLKLLLPRLKYWHTVPILIVLVLHVAYFICKFTPKDVLRDIVNVLCLIFSALIVLNFAMHTSQIVHRMSVQRELKAERQQEQEERSTAELHQPNIYYLMFDEYANFPQMELYNFKNEELKKFLTEHNFTISYTSRNDSIQSTTVQTNIANLDYVVVNNTSEADKQKLRTNGFLFSFLREHGYQVNIYETSFNYGTGNPISGSSSGEGVTVNGENLTDICMQQTIAYPFWGFDGTETARVIVGMANYLSDPDNLPNGDTFTLGFFDFPHQPFLFDENGGTVNSIHLSDWDNDEYYLGQYKYATKLMMNILNNIVQNDPESVIIVQSDHGARATRSKNMDLFLKGKFAYEYASNFFNTVYFQGKEPPDIEGQSGVNTMRIVLNALLGTDFEILDVPEDPMKR